MRQRKCKNHVWRKDYLNGGKVCQVCMKKNKEDGHSTDNFNSNSVPSVQIQEGVRQKTKKMNKLIQEVIDFLIGNEQYGDDWKEHIDALNELLNQNKDE